MKRTGLFVFCSAIGLALASCGGGGASTTVTKRTTFTLTEITGIDTGGATSPLEVKIAGSLIRADQLYRLTGTTASPVALTPANNPDDGNPYLIAAPNDINSAGQVVGSSVDIVLTRPSWATLWSTTTATGTAVPLPSGIASQSSLARAISSDGRVLAQITGLSRAFVYQSGTSTLLSIPSGVTTSTALAVDVNSSGNIIGQSGSKVIYWSSATNGQVILVDSASVGYSARYISNNRLVIGESYDVATSSGNIGLWTYRPTTGAVQLTLPANRSTPRAFGISDTDIAVGYWTNTLNSTTEGWIYEDGVLEPFKNRISAGSAITAADEILGISENGTVIGRNRKTGGGFTTWIATPNP